MRWKRIASAVCAAPLVSGAGCNIAYYATKNILNEPVELADNLARTRDLRNDGRRVWKDVRGQYPRHLFTAEFHDGFLDGYTDYLDRGGDAVPPAVPPKKYTRNNYLTPEGQALIQDYFLGFQYGMDVAVATGKRDFLIVPLQLPAKNTAPPSFNVRPPGDPACGPNGGNCGTPGAGAAVGPPVPVPVPVPAPAGPTPPAGATAPPVSVHPPGSRIGPVPGAPTAPTVPAPAANAAVPRPLVPPRPVPAVPPLPPPAPAGSVPPPAAPKPPPPKPPGEPPGSKFGFPTPPAEEPVSTDPDVRIPATRLPLPESGPSPTGVELRLPTPPARVPTLPTGAPTPSVLDDLPVVPPNHLVPAARPPVHDLPRGAGGT